MSDRYADAVRARRLELRAERELLSGSHRHELHNALAASRIVAAADRAAALTDLGREVNSCLELADRAARRRIPALLDRALSAQVQVLHELWVAALRPSLLRIATERRLRMGSGWPRLPAPGPLRDHAPPQAVGMRRVLVAGAAEGAAVGRLLLVPLAVFPLAVFPLWGLPAIGGPTLAPLAVGIGIVAVVTAARARYAAAERAVLRRHCDSVLAIASVALDGDLGRRLLDVERSAVAALDAAVSRRRIEVEAELGELSPPAVVASDG